MIVLGISCYYHDSAAAIIKDGKILAAVEEERFSRKKFDDGFPNQAIDFCLNQANLKSEDIDIIAFYDKSILKFERLLDNYIAVAPRGLKSFLNVIPKWIHKRLWIKEEIKNHLKEFSGEILFDEKMSKTTCNLSWMTLQCFWHHGSREEVKNDFTKSFER